MSACSTERGPKWTKIGGKKIKPLRVRTATESYFMNSSKDASQKLKGKFLAPKRVQTDQV